MIKYLYLCINVWCMMVATIHALLKGTSSLHNLATQKISRRPFDLMRQNMFSGIVEDMGEVMALKINPAMKLWDGSVSEGVELTIKSSKAVEEAYIGCSIAVNGVCLTAIEYDHEKFTVGVSPETLRRSNLGALAFGSKVNVERALRADGRNSGHFVQGHVDSTATVLARWQEGDSLWIKLSLTPEYLKYVVPKGFVAIDGTSLTVCEVNRAEGWFTVMLVAHTQQHVIFPFKQPGDAVNIEVDVLGKLIESSVQASLSTITEQMQALQRRCEIYEHRVLQLEASLQQQQQQQTNAPTDTPNTYRV